MLFLACWLWWRLGCYIGVMVRQISAVYSGRETAHAFSLQGQVF